MVERRLMKELDELAEFPIIGCSVGPSDSDMRIWEAIITGPEGTPYQCGMFRLKISIPSDYPFASPTVKFLTKIYHPNVFLGSFNVCLGTQQTNWSPTSRISTLLLFIIYTLSNPNADSSAHPEAGRMYKNNLSEFNRIAQEWTRAHARV